MSTSSASHLQAPRPSGERAPARINHAAFMARDAATTTDFYTRVMGMELVHAVLDDHVPSTRNPFPYLHLLFQMRDGSMVAFFVAPGLPEQSKASHPAYHVFNHFAFHAESREELLSWKARLTSHGIDVIGPVDHNGELLSIYFHDPNGLRLEIAHVPADWSVHKANAQAALKQWCDVIAAAKQQGKDISTALQEHIHNSSKRNVIHEQ
jgi:catechol 2,3-dioxygenase-like lactoylglutathione lyase family enzyme